MADNFSYKKIQDFKKILLCLLVLSSRRCASSSLLENASDDSEIQKGDPANDLLRYSRSLGFSFHILPGRTRTPREIELKDTLKWLNQTIDVLRDVMVSGKEAACQLRNSSTANITFGGNLKCRIPQVEGTKVQIAKLVTEYFIEITQKIKVNSSERALEDTVKLLECFVVVIKELTSINDSGGDPVGSDEYDGFHNISVIAENQAKIILDDLLKWQQTLVDEYSTLKGTKSRKRRDTGGNGEIESVDYSNITLSEIQPMIGEAFDNLHSTVRQFSHHSTQLNITNRALSLAQAVIDELNSVIEYLIANNQNQIANSTVILTHGPYCQTIMTSGTPFIIVTIMLNDTLDYTLALGEKFQTTKALEEAVDDLICRAAAFSSMVQVAVSLLSDTEIQDIVTILDDSVAQVEVLRDDLQERATASQSTVDVLKGQMEVAKRRMRDLTSARLSLQSQSRSTSRKNPKEINVDVEQVVN